MQDPGGAVPDSGHKDEQTYGTPAYPKFIFRRKNQKNKQRINKVFSDGLRKCGRASRALLGGLLQTRDISGRPLRTSDLTWDGQQGWPIGQSQRLRLQVEVKGSEVGRAGVFEEQEGAGQAGGL